MTISITHFISMFVVIHANHHNTNLNLIISLKNSSRSMCILRSKIGH